jgi:hypothetical protein
MSNMDFPELKAPGQRPVVNSIFDFSDQALSGLRLYLEQNPPAIPITSILGFSGFTVKAAAVSASFTATLGTWEADGTHPGPTLSGLADGSYVLLWGAESNTSVAGAIAAMSAKVNSTASDFGMSASTKAVDQITIMSATTATLSNAGSNTVTCEYWGSVASGATGTFGRRFLIAIKYANK